MTNELKLLIEKAKAKWDAMTPPERRAMLWEQARSYVRAEIAFGTDADEREYVIASTCEDEEALAECRRKEQARLDQFDKMWPKEQDQ